MNAHRMRYKIVHSYKGNGIALNAKNQVLFSRTEYGANSRTEYFLATGNTERPLPEGFKPKLLKNDGQIIGYRDDQIVLFDNGRFREIGSGTVFDFNHQGSIVGSTEKDGKIFPCRWKDNNLAWIGDEPGVATAINEMGDVLIVETDDFTEYSYTGEDPFEVTMPHFRSFCLTGEEKVPLLGLDGQVSRVKAMDIDENRRIVGYSLHSSPEVEKHFDSEYGVPMFGSAPGSRSILWVDFVAKAIPQPAYSGGTTAKLIGPNETILGYSANSDLDLPACTYAIFEDDAFWSRGDDSVLLSNMTWGHPYMSTIHGINDLGCVLASNPSCQDLVLFEENSSSDQDYQDWERKVYEMAYGRNKGFWPNDLWTRFRGPRG